MTNGPRHRDQFYQRDRNIFRITFLYIPTLTFQKITYYFIIVNSNRNNTAVWIFTRDVHSLKGKHRSSAMSRLLNPGIGIEPITVAMIVKIKS